MGIISSIKELFVPNRSMEFRVGEGLTPEQSAVAHSVVRKVDPLTSGKPLSFSESQKIQNQKIISSAREKQGKPINPLFVPSKELVSEANENILGPAMGAVGSLKIVGNKIVSESAKDLVQYAKKFKRFKDFKDSLNILLEDSWSGSKHPNADSLVDEIKGNYFHGTTNADMIKEKGFKSGNYFNSGVYFSDKPNIAIDYMNQSRGSGMSPGVIVSKLDNLKIKEVSYDDLRNITKGYPEGEDLVLSLKNKKFNGVKAKETGETFVWDVNKIGKVETIEDIFEKSQELQKGSSNLKSLLGGSAISALAIPKKEGEQPEIPKAKKPKILETRHRLVNGVSVPIHKLENAGEIYEFHPKLKSPIEETYKKYPQLKKGVLEALLMKESSMGYDNSSKNDRNGAYGWLGGITPIGKKEMIRLGYAPELDTIEGVLDAMAFFWLAKDRDGEDPVETYHREYSSGKLNEKQLAQFKDMYDYYSTK